MYKGIGISDGDKMNPNGGAIAYGHPLGMSGTRLVLSASKELELIIINMHSQCALGLVRDQL